MKNMMFILLILPMITFAKAPSVVEGVYIFDSNKSELKHFKRHKDLVIDHLSPKGYEVYGPEGLIKWVQTVTDKSFLIISTKESNFDHGIITHEQNKNDDINTAYTYPSSADIVLQLKRIVARNSKIMTMKKIGNSGEGKGIYAIKISDNPKLDELEPEVKYIANMHGDEIVGRELMVRLVRDLGNQYRAGKASTKKLIDNTEIFIIASMNPDGADRRRRGNANYKDLNRDFPDFTTSDNRNTPHNRQPETKAIMKFQAAHNFALSANFHGGAVCVNYPWDTSHQHFPLKNLVVDLSLEYASMVPEMRNSSRFPNGITNGHDWYEVNGGMQDWSYHWYGDMQVTVELSGVKWPTYSTVDDYYKENKRSLMTYLKRVHQGAGIKLTQNYRGRVEVLKKKSGRFQSIGSYTPRHNEFYKVLEAGEYIFKAEGKEYSTVVRKDHIAANGNYINRL